jgi:hypothetical protein
MLRNSDLMKNGCLKTHTNYESIKVQKEDQKTQRKEYSKST